MLRETPGLSRAPPDPPRPRTTVPRPPYMAALGVVGERSGANAKLGERRASKGAIPGTACSVPGKGGIIGEAYELPAFSGLFPSRGIFFAALSLVWVFHSMESAYFRGWYTIIPSREFFSYPRLFLAFSGRRPTLYAQDRGTYYTLYR